MAFAFIDEALAKRQAQGLFRQRVVIDSAQGPIIEIQGQHYLNFSSNDYLAMRRSTTVAQAWADGINEFGGGSGASPLVTGYTQAHQALEVYLAEQLGREKVLLFNSGFAANQALCQGLFGAGLNTPSQSHILADKLMHASFLDGAMASSAKLQRFKHNDLSHFQHCFSRIGKDLDTLVATESVFSMDGDQGPVTDIVHALRDSEAWLMVDDAHGFGVLGEQGLGVAEQYNLTQQQLPILMATFGKAIGTAGAFIAGSEKLIDYLINFSRHYIYSTAMPAAQAYATLVSLQSSKRLENKHVLDANIQLFRHLCQTAGIPISESQSAIQPIILGEASKALHISSELKRLGIWVGAIRYPTVPKGSDRLRITITAGHTKQDIEALVDALTLTLDPLPSRDVQ